MHDDVAMKQPVTGACRRPRELHRGQFAHAFGDLQCARRTRNGVGLRIAACLDGKIESVQVHRMVLTAHIDDAPVHLFAFRVVQAFGDRPHLAVD